MKKYLIVLFAFCVTSVHCAETLFGNYALNVNESSKVGDLWVFSRGDVYSGVTILTLNVGSSGVQVVESKQEQMSDSSTAVHDGIFNEILAERRRTPSVYAGKLGYVLPMYGLDDNNNYFKPEGFFSVRGIDNLIETPLKNIDAMDDLDSAMQYATYGFAFDSIAKKLWIARGAMGLGVYDISGNSPKQGSFELNIKTNLLDSAKQNYKWNANSNPQIFDVKLHPKTSELWIASSKGLWKRFIDGKISKASKTLDTSMRVTGLWMGGDPLKIIAETSNKGKESSIKGALWIYDNKKQDFVKVNFLDTALHVQKKDIYDDGDFTVSSIAFVGKNAFISVIAAGGSVSGYFKLDSLGIRAYDADENNKGKWLYGFETGATDRDVLITSMCAFPLKNDVTGLALSTYGNGISVSADSGATWTTILNRAKLSGNLGTIRMVPSVIVAGDQSLVSYKVSKNSKITIEVFSYDMRHVRTIVKSVARDADASRSTNPKVDFWDGYDKAGRACTMGVYYVRVKDNHGHVGWGKVMTLGGNK